MISSALPFVQIDPIALDLGFLQIRWYALAYLAGILLAWLTIRGLLRFDKRRDACEKSLQSPLVMKHFDDFISWAAMGIILGGRLGYCLLYAPLYYLENPLQIFAAWNGGMSFHGGLFGLSLALYFYARSQKLALWRMADYLAITAPLGLFFGRIANFINNELIGRPSDLPWAIVFPIPDYMQHLTPQVARHPSQLYEAFLEGLLLFVIMLALHRFSALRLRSGQMAGIFFAYYGLARFLVEFTRQFDPTLPLIGGWMTHGQLYSLPLIVLGAVLFWQRGQAHSKLKMQ